MADAQATFTVKVDVQGQASAENTAKALADLKGQITADTKALQEMQATMRRLNQGSNVSIESFRNLRAQITAKKQAIADASNKLVGFKGAFEQLTPAVSDSANGIKELAADVLGVDRRIGPFKVNALKAVPPLLAIGLAASVAGVALAALAVKVVSFGIAAADARRDEDLFLQGANVAIESVDRVSAAVAISRTEVGKYAKELSQAGLAGSELETALSAVSTAASAGADTSQLVKNFAALKGASKAVDALAAKTQSKFGGIVKKQMLGLTTQSMKLKESIGLLFKDVDLEPILTGFQKITNFFSETESSGRAIKTIITAAFSALGPIVSFLAPLVQGFLKGIVIGALLVTIALLKVRNWFRETFGGTTLGDLDLVKGAVYAGAAVVLGLAAALALVAGVVGAVFYGLYKIAEAIIFVANTIGSIWSAAYNFLVQSFTNIGPSLIDGIVNGIRSGASRVIDAVKGLASSVTGAFTGALKIGSPSKVFEGYGGNIAMGAERGIDRGAPGVQGAVDDMAPAPSGKPAAGARAGGGATINLKIENLTIHANDPAQVPGIVAAFKEQLAQALEEVSAELGLSTEDAA